MTEIELEMVSKMADARLGVAERFSWYIAGLLALVAHLRWDSWLLTAGAGVIGFFLSVHNFRKDSRLAKNAYAKASKTGDSYY